MKARWLWTTWTHLVVVGIVALDVLFFAFSNVMLLPKLRKIQKRRLARRRRVSRADHDATGLVPSRPDWLVKTRRGA